MKKLISVIILFFVFTSMLSTANAWYGAGYSKGWPNTYNGGRGKVNEPYYKTPPASYNTNEMITLSFEIENPQINQEIISHQLFVQVWKVEEKHANTEELPEDTLYQNHILNQDTQSFYKTISLGNLTLSPGEKTQFNAQFAIEDAGYFQFDLTDLSKNDEYQPGHIYSAGFLRVKSAPEALGVDTNQEKKYRIGALALTGSILFLLIFLFLLRKKIHKQTN